MPAKRKANPSIISGVFQFVSRELEHFVASATGSTLPESDVFSEVEDEEYDDNEHGIVHEESSEQPNTRSPPKKRTKTGSHASPEVRRSQHDSSTLPKKDRLGHREEHVIADDNSAGIPSPPPLPRALKRRSSIPMPGSLFPRSPSLEPEGSSNTEREQRVRFASTNPDSPHPHFSPRKSVPPSTPRHRKQFDPTVQAAVGRFQEDADPSILLPKVRTSPRAAQYSKAEKGKGSATDTIPIEECEASEILRVRGKEKELVAVREDLDRNEQRLESIQDAETSFLEKIKQDRDRDKEKIRMLEGEIERLKKELMRRPAQIGEFLPPPPPPPPPPPKTMIALPKDACANPALFASARASLRHAPVPVENPINPLPVSRRAAGMPTVGIAPDKMAAFLNEMKTVRLRKVSASEKRSTLLGSDTSFASAPNMSIGGGADLSSSLFRRSVSSVNRDASWSYRNVASTGNNSMSEIEFRRGEKRKRTITGPQEELRLPLRHRSAASSAESSFATASNTSSIPTNDSLAGPSLSQPYPPIRPATSTGGSWPSSSVTDAPTPSLCSDNEVERDETSLDDQSPSTPPVTTGPSRVFFRSKGNDIPVEPERLPRRNSDVPMADALQPNEQEASHPETILKSNAKPTIFDKRPPTSPFPHKSPRRPRPPPRKTQTNQQTLPSHSTSHHASLSDDDEDPLSLTFSSPERALQASKLRRIQSRQKDDASGISLPSLPPTPFATASRTSSNALVSSQSQSHSRPRQSPRHRSASVSSRSSRRLTLDKELRNAFAAGATPFSRADGSHIHDDEEDEDSVFVGVGTRSKGRGFLPGGGAAGIPVFRGVGYVEGALEDDELLDEEPRHSRRSVSRGSRQRGDDDEEYLPPSKRGVHR